MFFHVSFQCWQFVPFPRMVVWLFEKRPIYRDMIVIYLLYKTVTYPNQTGSSENHLLRTCHFGVQIYDMIYVIVRSQGRPVIFQPCGRSWSFGNLSQGKLYRESRQDPTKKLGETRDSYSIPHPGNCRSNIPKHPGRNKRMAVLSRLGGDMDSIPGKYSVLSYKSFANPNWLFTFCFSILYALSPSQPHFFSEVDLYSSFPTFCQRLKIDHVH